MQALEIIVAIGAAIVLGQVIARRLRLPDPIVLVALGLLLTLRMLTILRSESLINDGTALVVYALALSLATADGAITIWRVGGLFAVSFFGGIAVGLGVGWLLFAVRRRVTDPTLNAAVLVLAPFTAYLGAEMIHASGVLAVVACGLLFLRLAPSAISAAARWQSTPFGRWRPSCSTGRSSSSSAWSSRSPCRACPPVSCARRCC